MKEAPYCIVMLVKKQETGRELQALVRKRERHCSRRFTSINDAMLWIDDAILRINETILQRTALGSILSFVGQLYYMKMASSSRGRVLFRGGTYVVGN